MTLEAVFEDLRSLFTPFEGWAELVSDTPTRYCLATHEVRARDGYRTGFGSVEIGKRYVAVHLMPVYVHPELLDGLSPALRRRMQGKSCFNFRGVDPLLRQELEALVQSAAHRFASDGRLRPGA
jgi:hypothetical protein